MPSKHAALKQLRKDRVRHKRNQALRSELKTITKQFAGLLREQKTDEARQLLRRVFGTFDRAATRGIIHRNNASRSKSRLTRRISRSVATPKSK